MAYLLQSGTFALEMVWDIMKYKSTWYFTPTLPIRLNGMC